MRIMTASSVNREHKITVGAGVFERHFIVCEIDISHAVFKSQFSCYRSIEHCCSYFESIRVAEFYLTRCT